MDLRAYRDETDPRNAKFIDLAADFAAAIRGVPKEDLMSEEVRQQRRARRLAVGAATALLVLAGAAAWQWSEAVKQRTTAVQQRDAALIAQSRLLSKASQDALGTGSTLKATLLALEALPGKGSGEARPYVIDAERALRVSLVAPQEVFRLSAKFGSDDQDSMEHRVAIGDTDIFIAEDRDILRYHVPSRTLSRSPLDDPPTAIHLSNSNRLFIGTKGRRVLVSGLAGEAPAVFADVPFDIAKISSSSDSAFVVVTGEETWSVFDGNTGRLIARRQGSDSDATPNGKVVYEANAPAPHDKDRAELRMFDPSTLQDIPLFSPGKDSVITSFTLDRTGDVLAILASDQIVVINIPTTETIDDRFADPLSAMAEPDHLRQW